MLPIRLARDAQEAQPMEIDPVCGMEVDPANAEWKIEHDGTTYYFCSKGCFEDFVEDPAAFVA